MIVAAGSVATKHLSSYHSPEKSGFFEVLHRGKRPGGSFHSQLAESFTRTVVGCLGDPVQRRAPQPVPELLLQPGQCLFDCVGL